MAVTWLQRLFPALARGPSRHLEELAQQLEETAREVGKLGREQFRATTLLEGQAATLDELAEAWREHLGQHRQEAAGWREARDELPRQARLELARDLLPVVDALAESIRSARELAAGVEHAPPTARGPLAWLWGARAAQPPARADRAALDAWLAGLLLVERRLLALLEREGVRPIPSLGQQFDPHLHVAVAVERNGSLPDGAIVREERRGYTLGERVLRHAEVVVARRGEH